MVIGPTDPNSNVILNKSIEVGRKSKAGSVLIVIGSGGVTGPEVKIVIAIEQRSQVVQNTNDLRLIKSFEAFCEDAKKSEQNKPILLTLWEDVNSIASLSGVIDMIIKVSVWVGKF